MPAQFPPFAESFDALQLDLPVTDYGPFGCAECISTLIFGEIVLCRNDIAEVAHVLAKNRRSVGSRRLILHPAPTLAAAQNRVFGSARQRAGADLDPAHGNAACLAVEDRSFWFRHRNRVIVEIVGRFHRRGMFWMLVAAMVMLQRPSSRRALTAFWSSLASMALWLPGRARLIP